MYGKIYLRMGLLVPGPTFLLVCFFFHLYVADAITKAGGVKCNEPKREPSLVGEERVGGAQRLNSSDGAS